MSFIDLRPYIEYHDYFRCRLIMVYNYRAQSISQYKQYSLIGSQTSALLMRLMLDPCSPYAPLENTIAELERDCDTLENEANRLLNINRDLRQKYGDESMVEVQQQEQPTQDASFANELILDGELVRPGPEGSEETMDANKNDTIEPKEETKPRYTLMELEEVLNEKNKYKGEI